MKKSSSFILVTMCTNRKIGIKDTVPLHPGRIPKNSQEVVTEAWIKLVENAQILKPAHQMYSGRGFKESIIAVQGEISNLWIISAGMGLISALTKIPTYNITVVNKTDSSIQQRLNTQYFNISQWWSTLNYGLRQGYGLSELVRANPDTTIVISLSNTYALLILQDILKLEAEEMKSLRLVGLMSAEFLPEVLRPCWMPYNSQFDGPESPLPGTRSDYPQRTARHFIEEVLLKNIDGTVSEHYLHVQDIISNLPLAQVYKRTRVGDNEIQKIIYRRWNDACGSSTKMLRLLRDEEQVSCEQSRFTRLFKTVKINLLYEKR